jgi:hypothetical protein
MGIGDGVGAFAVEVTQAFNAITSTASKTKRIGAPRT